MKVKKDLTKSFTWFEILEEECPLILREADENGLWEKAYDVYVDLNVASKIIARKFRTFKS